MEEEIRIVHIVNGEHYAGAERVQDLLAGKLSKLNCQVSFVCLKEGIFAESRRNKSTPLVHFPMRWKIDLRVVRQMISYVRREKFNLIHTHSPRAGVVGALVSLRTGVPLIHHVHSPTARDTESRFRNALNSFTEKLCFARASRLIPVSASLEQYLLDRGLRAKKIRPVLNGVPVQKDIDVLRYVGQTLVLGTVALFRPRKGTEVLIQSLSRLRRAGLDVRMLAVGPFETPEYEKSVRALVSELDLDDAITWTGFTTEVFAQFSNMHAFVLPSLYGEGMPMVVLEAMSAGLPVISTTVEGIPEVIREGREGLLVPPDDVGALVAAVTRITDKVVDLAELGQNGKERQRAHFSDESMAKGVANVYRELL